MWRTCCGLVFSKAMAGDERDLDSLGATVWRRMPLFMAGRVSGGLEATPTATRRAVTRRISLMESPLTDDEILLLDGWSPTPTALWRLKARGRID